MQTIILQIWRSWLVVLTAVLTCLAGTLPRVVLADTLQLRNGSVFQGKWLNPDEKGATHWKFELEGGTQIEVVRSQARIAPSLPDIDKYADGVRKGDDSLEWHRRIVEACIKLNFTALELAHRERIVELDPEDKTSWAALGYLKTTEGWLPKDQVQRRRGLLPKGGKWDTPQNLAIVEAREEGRVKQAEVRQKVTKSLAAVRTNAPKSDEARRYLNTLDDPWAVIELRSILKAERAAAEKDRNKSNPAYRRQLLEIIGRVRCADTVGALLETAVDDPDDILRSESVDKLNEFGREIAVQALLSKLTNNSPKNDNPVVYDRVGYALSVLGDERCLPRLIDCLETKHIREPPPQPGYNVGKTSDGGLGLSQGQKKPVEFNSQNAGILAALVEISGESFGFDTAAWLNWYASAFAASNPYVLRDP